VFTLLEAAWGPFARGARGENARWGASVFDATLGFPGEGPDLEMPRAAESRWMEKASRVLEGAECFGNTWFTNDLSSSAIHDLLVALAERGNSPDPIAARVQLYPAQIEQLLGSNSTTARQAMGGCAYNLDRRPYQYHRPRPIRLDTASLQAACDEIDRLEFVCRAVEAAPTHDRDKALFADAPLWERRPLPRGPWPQEKRVLVFTTKAEARAYDAA
jgi:hypothetical protein